MLGKTQREVENEYFFIDLPELLMIKDQVRATEMLQEIDVVSFPHITDEKARDAIFKRITSALPKPSKEQPKSAEEQYKAQLARMMGR